MSIRIKLRKDAPNKQGQYPIVLVYQKGRKETIFSTGKYTNAEFFTQDTQNPLSSGQDYKANNILIRNLYSKLNNIADGYFMANNEYPSNEWVKLQWNTKNAPNQPVFDFYDRFMQYQQTRGASSVSYGTAINYKNVKNKLIGYERKSGHPIAFESFNESFANKFSQYLIKEHDLLPNSVGEKLKIVKTFLRWCIKQGVRIPSANLEAFRGGNDKTWKLHLTIEDLKALAQTNTQYEETKDGFLLQSCLGVRYSDLQTIVSTKIIKEGEDFYYITNTQKTNKLIKVKLIDMAKEILNRRSGNWIPSNIQMNTELKLIFKSIRGFDEMVSVSQGSGNLKREHTKPKYEFVSTHTARISYINIMRNLGVDDFTISNITGQSLSTLRGYYHSSAKDTDSAMNALNLAF
jgi:hypothetical protein